MFYSKVISYGDERSIAECRYAFNHPQLAGIRSAKQTTEWCETVMNDYRHLKEQGYEVVFYGYLIDMGYVFEDKENHLIFYPRSGEDVEQTY